MENIINLIKKHFDLIAYAIFGVLTTLVNIFAYWLFAHIFKESVMTSTIIAWILAVFFAYITNRKWVFFSKATKMNEILKEILYFYICRLATGFIDWGSMYYFVKILNWNDMIIKIGANIVVIILNYVASKLIIFKKG